MKTSIAVIALVLSSLSLAFQVKNANRARTFDSFMVPAKITEFDFRALHAEVGMIKEGIVQSNGIGVPHIKGLSDDHRVIIVQAWVSEEDLPKNYEKRKSALNWQAWNVVGSISEQFGLGLTDGTAQHVVRVEFISFEGSLGKGEPKIYAEMNDGVLTFH